MIRPLRKRLRWRERRRHRPDVYPCVDPRFDSAQEANLHIAVEAVRPTNPELLDLPRVYLCVNGHFHYKIGIRPDAEA